MDIAAVRAGLAANAATLGQPLTTFGYVPDSIPEPAFYVATVDVDFTGAMSRGLDLLDITCRILTSRADDRSGQAALDAYISGSGPRSLKAALETDCTLAGACDDLMVLRVQGYGLYEHAGTNYLGAELVVRVIGDGS